VVGDQTTTPALAPEAPPTTPAAVLWDMDGTLVDTEPYWIETEFALAAEYGGTWSRELALQLVGNDLITSGRFIRRHMGIDLTPQEIVERLLDGVVARVQHEVPWRPGARELLEELRQARVPCALVTMSYERFVAPILAHLPVGSFRAVVTGDAVSRGKPDPEPYLTAARLLAVDPRECLAIEDSDPGATSAEAAGCPVLVVPHHVDVPHGPGRIFRESLVGLAPNDLGLLPDRDLPQGDLQ
jgi:HAD superfamily hydrolase (TIGR01509 family)